MSDRFAFSALDGYVSIDGNNVSITDDKEVVIKVSVEEWEILKEQFRFDDVVDYARGETPMTCYQFSTCVKLIRELKELKAERDQLINRLNG